MQQIPGDNPFQSAPSWLLFALLIAAVAGSISSLYLLFTGAAALLGFSTPGLEYALSTLIVTFAFLLTCTPGGLLRALRGHSPP